MGVLDIFIDRKDKEPEGKKKGAPANLSSVGIPSTPVPQVVVDNGHITASSSSSIQDVVDQLKALMEDENRKNFPGNDFYEFLIMKNALVSLPTEELKYTSAFAGLAVSGMTKDKLLATARKYKEVIDKENQEFQNSYTSAYGLQVVVVNNQIENRAMKLKQCIEQMNALNAEITDLKKSRQEAADRLTAKKVAFESGVNRVKGEIDEEISKINQYIK